MKKHLRKLHKGHHRRLKPLSPKAKKIANDVGTATKGFFRFLRDWSLPISILAGLTGYFIAREIPFLFAHRETAASVVTTIQPILIFAMLYITFCKVDIRDLHLHRWHLHLLLIQAGAFALLSLVVILFPTLSWRVVVEGAMLCMICPTATAAVVITSKLGGDTASLTTYTILINLAVSLVVPVLVPLVNPQSGATFISSFLLIIYKVFPLLMFPLLLAVLTRRFAPWLHRLVLACKGLAFYLWIVNLSLAIAVTTRSIAHTRISVWLLCAIGLGSLVCCIVQFYVGHRVGEHYGCPIAAGQSIGQKNTVFAIWMGYTFLTPVSAVAGGFYSVWHNVYNSWQLYQKRKEDAKIAST